jgi:short-subunit dehydrogenase
MSSCTGVFLSPFLGIYSSVKHSLDCYSRTLYLENSDRVDVLSVRPFGVATKMMDMKKGAYMISPKQCVISTLADLLAGESVTFTHLDHCLSGTVFTTLSEEEAFKMFETFWKAGRSEAP